MVGSQEPLITKQTNWWDLGGGGGRGGHAKKKNGFRGGGGGGGIPKKIRGKGGAT